MRHLAVAALTLLLAGLVIAVRLRAQWIEKKLAMAVVVTAPAAAPAPACDPESRGMVLIGDSRVAQWPMPLFGGAVVVNKGRSGETALQLTARFERDALSCRPQSVVIATGINDLIAASLAPGDEAQGIVTRLPGLLIALAETAAQTGAAVSVATIVPPARPDFLRRLAWSESVRGYVADVNTRLRAHTWTGDVTLLDFARTLDPRSEGTLPERYRRDTLHFNAAAYEALMGLWPFSHSPVFEQGSGSPGRLARP